MIVIIETGRVGERHQCEALARALNMPAEIVPPWAMPTKMPDIILSFGKALKPGLALHHRLRKKPLFIQLGRPRLFPTALADLVIIMPQDDYPKSDNTLHLKFPLNSASLAVGNGSTPASFSAHRAKTTLFLNGPTAHHVLGQRECDDMLRLSKIVAHRAGESLQVLLSHRTPQDVAQYMREICQHNVSVSRRPLQEVLDESARVIVTADSASLLADALRSGLPTWLYSLPARKTIDRFLKSASCALVPRLRASLILKGLVAGGTDFDRWHEELIQSGLICPLNDTTVENALWRNMRPYTDDDIDLCVQRIQALLAHRGVSIRPEGVVTPRLERAIRARVEEPVS